MILFPFICQAQSGLDRAQFLAKPQAVLKITEHGVIYSTRDTASVLYKWMNAGTEANHIASEENARAMLARFPNKVIVNDLDAFPSEWNVVYSFKGQFHLFAPGDFIEHYGYKISGSFLHHLHSDPRMPYLIRKFEWNDSAQLELLDHEGKSRMLSITLLDAATGVHRWKFDDGETVLMQDSRFIKTLPMIVRDCGNQKCILEFNLDSD